MSYIENHKYVNVTADENTSGVSIEMNKSNFDDLNIAFNCSDFPTVKVYVKDGKNANWILIYDEKQEKTADLLIFPHFVFNYVKVVIPESEIDIELAVKAA